MILATSLLETLHKYKSDEVQIDVLVRRGNESLLKGHPFLNEVLIWNKKSKKYRQLLKLTAAVRKKKYDRIYNLQRFGATGWLTWRSGAKMKIGFRKNPFSFAYHRKLHHKVGDGTHEIERNFQLIKDDLPKGAVPSKPKLYPGSNATEKVEKITRENAVYYVFAPASVWFTKQMPFEKWCALIQQFSKEQPVYLIGGPGDHAYLESIKLACDDNQVINLAGDLGLLESALLISKAKRTYVNDSAPLHLASAMNAPVTAFFCSTVPDFGFGPLSEDSQVLGVKPDLPCRPCGIHGQKACPKKHFKCGHEIELTVKT